MTWLETLTSTPVLIAGAVGASALLYSRSRTTAQVKEQAKEVAHAAGANGGKAKMAQAVS